MILRTFLRTFFDTLFAKNPVIESFVNICYKNDKNKVKTIKFNSNVPITNIERKKEIFFQSVTGDRIDCKW